MADLSELFAQNPYAQGAPAPRVTSYNTRLDPASEIAFRGWLAQNKVPFDPEAGATDYDMRGFYSGLMSGDPRARSAVDPHDKRMHYPDFWKTPGHTSFSAESQWAGPVAPQWNQQDQLVAPNGRIVSRPPAQSLADLFR
jgi:hypothetical protein